MFGKNDKISLTLINARDINGNIIPFQLSLPVSNKEYTLPEELVSIDVFEYHEGLTSGGNVAFTIYVGQLTTLNQLSRASKNKLQIMENIKIESINTPVCIKNIYGKPTVFATISEQDIVVETIEQLIQVVRQLSNNFAIINNSSEKIRMLYKKYNGNISKK